MAYFIVKKVFLCPRYVQPIYTTERVCYNKTITSKELILMKKNAGISLTPEGRLLSLDFFRWFTMFLLIGEFTGLFTYLVDPSLKAGVINFIGTQLHHHPWNGMHFWDPVQPFFMFIVGGANRMSHERDCDCGPVGASKQFNTPALSACRRSFSGGTSFGVLCNLTT